MSKPKIGDVFSAFFGGKYEAGVRGRAPGRVPPVHQRAHADLPGVEVKIGG